GFTTPETVKNEFTSAEHIGKPDKKYIKVALLLDTSNSMDGLINQAKAYLWDMVNELSYARHGKKAPNLLIALYEYGNDDLPSSEGYIRQVIGFTDDLDELSEKLFSLTTNGGAEFCGQAIMTSLKQLDWGKDPDDLKLIFIAGNEPFTQGKTDYRDVAKDAVEKDVVVNTIHCGSYNTGVRGMWADGAKRTRGEYMAIDHNEKIVEITTPYDPTILKLNIQLNQTYIPYGNQGRYKAEMQVRQDANASSVNEEIALKRAVSKSSGMYRNAAWDLVDATKDKSFDYGKLKKAELPEMLKGKSSAEIKAYVNEKAKERASIQQKIQELHKKRMAYIAKEHKNVKASKSLNSVMIKAIKAQAKAKNYTWTQR
ncbi:MAG: vWA domain-containing protein, partial [Bacteroidota bacterium]